MTNLTAVGELGREWNSQPLINFQASLSEDSSNANAGGLQGNRMFYTNDYMVGGSEIRVFVMYFWLPLPFSRFSAGPTMFRHSRCGLREPGTANVPIRRM